MVPKVENPEILSTVDRLVAECEREAGLDVGRIRLLALIETAKAMTIAEEICAAAPERVHTVIFGLGDFSVDIGVDLTVDATELLYARSRVVIAARAARLAPPIDGPWLRLEDQDGLVADSLRSRQLGFQGRVIVYPPQVEPAQRAYADLPEEEARIQREIVRAFDAALAEGLASIRVEGRFIDYPLYYRAKHKLKLYDALHA
jgi:citrate lyase subunit beta/citryl-CoA lyase